jgi:hypothetical protein
MTWQTGTSTDYLDLLTQLIQVATSEHVATAAVSAAGTGYVVGDILIASGGTSTHGASFEVLTVGGSGEITSLRIATGGAYTTPPASPVSTTGGAGSGGTVTVTFADTGWTLRRESQQALSAAIGAGGAGYAVGQTLTVVGGLGVGTAAQFSVATEAAGVITSVTLLTAGIYEEVPANDVAVTGGTGTGALLTVTWEPATVDKVVLLEGEGGGSDEILVGIKTFNRLDPTGFLTVFNWSLHGAAGGFNAGLPFHEQPGMSPGLDASTGAVLTTGGAYVPLKAADAFPMDFWFSITPRRIVGIVKVENASIVHYMQFYMGFVNQMGTPTEFPYPIFVCGASARDNVHYATTTPALTGLVCMNGLTGKVGPGFWRLETGTWQEFKNSVGSDVGAASRTASTSYCCYPGGVPQLIAATEDQAVATGSALLWDAMVPSSGVPGTPTTQLMRTPNVAGDLVQFIPATLIAGPSPNTQIIGELDGVFWFSAVNGESSEDTFLIDGIRYRIFQSGNRVETFTYVAVKED